MSHIKHKKQTLPIVLVLAFCFLLVGLFGALVGRILFGASGDLAHSTRSIAAQFIMPQVFMLVYSLLVAIKLGLLQKIWRDNSPPVRLWVWIVPIILLTVSLFAADWKRIAHVDFYLVFALLLAVFIIATAEEIMFRGVVLRMLRNRYHEFVAAMITTVLFALSHSLAGLELNPIQIIATACGGYLFYLSYRVSRYLIVVIIVHAMLDFSLFSNSLGIGDNLDNLAPAILFAEVILSAVFLFLYRYCQAPIKKIEQPRSVNTIIEQS